MTCSIDAKQHLTSIMHLKKTTQKVSIQKLLQKAKFYLLQIHLLFCTQNAQFILRGLIHYCTGVLQYWLIFYKRHRVISSRLFFNWLSWKIPRSPAPSVNFGALTWNLYCGLCSTELMSFHSCQKSGNWDELRPTKMGLTIKEYVFSCTWWYQSNKHVHSNIQNQQILLHCTTWNICRTK